jgi:ribosome biogenesis GTPase
MVDDIEAEQLQFCCPDFEPYFGSCRFQDCRHLNEPDCAISDAVRTGALAPTRYESYKRLYDLIKTQSRNNY